MADSATLLKNLQAALPGAVRGSIDRFGVREVRLERERWVEAVRFLKEDPSTAMEMLVDLVAVDYSAYPGHVEDRFGLIAHLKSLTRKHRLSVKCLLPEESPEVGTLTGLYRNAHFLEREAYDQMGLRFTGHPHLKRLLNHHEFVGHPLRKDYPLKKRQWLSANESLMDEMDVRLREKGWA